MLKENEELLGMTAELTYKVFGDFINNKNRSWESVDRISCGRFFTWGSCFEREWGRFMETIEKEREWKEEGMRNGKMLRTSYGIFSEYVEHPLVKSLYLTDVGYYPPGEGAFS